MPRTRAALAVVLTLLMVVSLSTSAATAATVAPGDILVADPDSGTIRHYSSSGVDLGIFASGLIRPNYVTADQNGNIYVAEFEGSRVDKFSPSGAILLTIATPYQPGGVQVGSDGTIYVGDYFGGDVFRYSASGTALGLFVSLGLARADFLAFDGSGNLYVTDFIFGVVRRISPAGVDLGNVVTGFPGPEGIAFDAGGNLYVSSFNFNFIEVYSASGTDLGTFASISPSGAAYGLAFDAAGNLYVADYLGGNIHRFSPSGTDLGIFASSGLVGPRDLVVVPLGGLTTKDECENGGWESFEFPRTFKNQGDCIQFVNTGK